MSDYKEIEIDLEVNNQERLVGVLERVLNSQVELHKRISQRWGHPTMVDIAIRQDQLPAEIQGFGDIGINIKNGKFVWVTVSDHDAQAFFDKDFLPKVRAWQQDIQDGYAATTFQEEIASQVAPVGTRIGRAEPVEIDGELCWAVEAEIPASALRGRNIVLA